MNVKVVNRYVELLTDIIDKKVRIEGKKALFDKPYIMAIMSRNDDEEYKTTEKIYKETIKWFKEKSIFDTVGTTSNLRYKLHEDFKYKISNSRDTVIRQCRFIIGQMYLYSDKVWGETESLYVDVISSDGFFELLPSIQSQPVKDTISTLLIHQHNEKYNGHYTYEILQALSQNHTPFNIHIENESISTSLKSVSLQEMIFNTDTITVVFNNSQFELESFETISDIKIPITSDIYNNIDKSIEYIDTLAKTDTKDMLIKLLTSYKSAHKIFFQDIRG
jgi:hypothetical protein